jgi:hypothetical protein
MVISGNKENRTDQNSADAADHRNGTAPSKTIRVCLMPVHYDQYPKDRETDRLADQADSSRDPLQRLSAEKRVGRFKFRLWYSSEPEAEIGGGIHEFSLV